MKASAYWLIGSLLWVAVGCGGAGETSPGNPAADARESSTYLLAAEPDGGRSLLEVRETASDGDEIVVIGRIGGTHAPFLDGYAGFTIIDASVKHCGELHDDGCPTPWDYCCTPAEELSGARALVKLVDDEGKVIRGDAKALLGAAELKTVVVRGKARRDDAGNLTVEASGVHVRS